MNLKKFLWVGTVIFLGSCGTQKKVVKNYPKKIQQKKVINTTNVDKDSSEEVVVAEKVVNKPKETVLNKNIVNTPVKVIKESKGGVTQDYLNTYASIAVREMHIYKIPASITLAQGVLESGSGRSPLAVKSNNHFGIKCHKGWKGNSVSHDDDELGECFRKYKHPETSYEDHSKFLTSRSRYAGLFKLNLTDYKGWAYGLKNAGYATDVKYPRKLIAIIEKYNLDKYDFIDKSNVYVANKEVVRIRKSSSSHIVYKGDTLYSISKKYKTTVEKLKKLNGLVDNTLSIGQELLIP